MLRSPDCARQARHQHTSGDLTPERLQALVETTSDWIWEVDETGTYTFVNGRVRDLLGYEPHEVLGRPPFDFMAPGESDRVRGIFQEALQHRRPLNCVENTNIHKDGHPVILETSGIPLFRVDGSFCGYRGIDRDITRRKEVELALQQATREAEEANRAKDAFLAMVSHELRMPLAPILSAVNLLEEGVDPGGEWQSCVAVIRRNVEMQARLVDDLLDLSRIVKGKIELRLSVIDAQEQLEHALSTCRPDLEAKHLHLALDQKAEHTWVQADTTRFQQILLNVLRNAIKFTPAGGHVTIATENPSAADLTIVVRDTGQGIRAEALPFVFNAFEQGGRDVTRRFGGLGLGLAISRKLMELHGGRISVHSDGEGRGATFTLDFPVVAAPRRAAAAAPAVSAAHHAYRLLVVEDNTDALELMVHLLKRRGHQVKTATSIVEALRAAGANGFDLLISDIGLPDGSGTDLMRQVRSMGIVRGIALSGFGMESDLQNSYDAGFYTHLTKPVDFKVLLEQIDAAMGAPPCG